MTNDRTESPAEHAATPWIDDDEWRAGILNPSNGNSLVGRVAFAVIWTAGVWPIIAFFAFKGMLDPWLVWLSLAAFPAVSAVFVVTVVLASARFLRFRGTQFRMASVPGVIGGQLAGVIVLPIRVEPNDGFRLSFRCTQDESSGDTTTAKSLWEYQTHIVRTLEQYGGTTLIPVAFVIPSSALPTDEASRRTWVLQCEAKLAGPNLDLSFVVPVFRTETSREEIDVDTVPSPLIEYELHEPLAITLSREGIRMIEGPLSGEVTFVVPPFRNASQWLALASITTMLTGIAVVLWIWGPTIAAIFASVFALLLFAATLHLMLIHGVLTITGDEWMAERGWWPLLSNKLRFARSDIELLSAKCDYAVNGRPWNHLTVKLRNVPKEKPLTPMLESRWVERLWLDDLRERAARVVGTRR